MGVVDCEFNPHVHTVKMDFCLNLWLLCVPRRAVSEPIENRFFFFGYTNMLQHLDLVSFHSLQYCQLPKNEEKIK